MKRHVEAERFGGLEVYRQLILDWHLDRKLARLRTVENAVDIGRRSPKIIVQVSAVIVFVIVVVNEAAGAGFAGVRAIDIIVAVISVVGVILFLSVNDLLGPGVLFAFAAGRYHNPRIEERALLFIDMRASTAIAQRLGELRYLSLLNRFVGDVSFAVAEARAEFTNMSATR